MKSAFKRTKRYLKQLTHLLNSQQRIERLTQSNTFCMTTSKKLSKNRFSSHICTLDRIGKIGNTKEIEREK